MTKPLAQGARIGILGGGQLGRMLSVAASRLGYICHIFDPSSEAPAAQVADRHTAAAYDDVKALSAFAADVDVITYEFENIPTAALDLLEASGTRIYPGRTALATSQDRLTEKTFLQDIGLQTAPFHAVDTEADLRDAMEKLGPNGILKTRRFGYDGKGQQRLSSPDEIPEAIAALSAAPAVFEGFVDFSKEISVIVARAQDGQVAVYDPGENLHEGGILRRTTAPADIPALLRSDAALLAGKIVSTLEYVGVMGVELFVTPHGLIVNEIAPRVHNSGHWTQQGCLIDQFEQHIRAVAGLPLGDGARFADVEMENLIGSDIERLGDLFSEGASLHLYGKSEARDGRKMGHVNRIKRS
ncbi:MAG: 5-(carboxyamino)imidazole ribonucleotide synthase [Pseudomonadota bacterium]